MVSPLAAVKAYAAVQKIAAQPQVEEPTATSAGPSFAQLVNNAVTDAVKSSHEAEAKMASHAQGKGDLIDVVTSVSAAETSLETVMAVRDQVISAYQEIMRLQI